MPTIERHTFLPDYLVPGDRIVAWPDSMKVSKRRTGVVQSTEIISEPYIVIVFTNGYQDRAPRSRSCTVDRVVLETAEEAEAVGQIELVVADTIARLTASGRIQVTGQKPNAAGVAREIAGDLYDMLRLRAATAREIDS